MRKVWTIAATNLRRTLRERVALFFLFVFPMLNFCDVFATMTGAPSSTGMTRRTSISASPSANV